MKPAAIRFAGFTFAAGNQLGNRVAPSGSLVSWFEIAPANLGLSRYPQRELRLEQLGLDPRPGPRGGHRVNGFEKGVASGVDCKLEAPRLTRREN